MRTRARARAHTHTHTVTHARARAHTPLQGAHYDEAQSTAEAREMKLKADINILKRANLRLKGEKALDAKKV